MVDVGDKQVTDRRAVARAVVRMSPDTAAAVAVDERLHERWKSAFPPVLSSSSTRSMTTPGSIPLTMS